MAVRVLLLFVVCAVVASARPADADRVQLDVELATGDAWLVPGRWTTLTARLVGDSENRRIRLVAQSPSGPTGGCVLEHELELPSGARRQVSWPVFVDWYPQLDGLRVFAYEAGRDRLVAAWAWDSVDRLPPGTKLASSLSSGESLEHAPVAGIIGRARLLERGLDSEDTDSLSWTSDRVPEHPLGFDSVAVVVLAEPDSLQLSARAWEALHTWTLGGGHVVLAGIVSRFPDTAFPFATAVPWAGDPVTKRLGDIFGSVDADEAGTQVTLVPLDGAAGETLEDLEVLAVRIPWGFGSVTTLAFDPVDSSAAKALFEAGLLDFLLPVHQAEQQQMGWRWGRDPSRSGVAQDCRTLVAASPEAPPLPWVAIILVLGLTALWIGPGEMILLRRLGMQRLTWLSFPFTIAAVSLGLVWISYQLVGSEVIVRSVNLVSWDPGSGYVGEESWGGHFPGASARYVREGRGEESGMTVLGENTGVQIRSPGDTSSGAPRGRARIARGTLGSRLVGRYRRMEPLVDHSFSFGGEMLLRGLAWEESDPPRLRNDGKLAWKALTPSGTLNLPPGGSMEIEAAPRDQRSPMTYSASVSSSYGPVASFGVRAETALWQMAELAAGTRRKVSNRTPETIRHAGIHAWDGSLLRRDGRTVITLLAKDEEAPASPGAGDRVSSHVIIRILVP